MHSTDQLALDYNDVILQFGLLLAAFVAVGGIVWIVLVATARTHANTAPAAAPIDEEGTR